MANQAHAPGPCAHVTAITEDDDQTENRASARFSHKEWDRIEKCVPQSVKSVGRLFSASAEAIVRKQEVVTPKLAWNSDLWQFLNDKELPHQGVPTPGAKGKAKKPGRSAKADIIAATTAKMWSEDRDTALKKGGACPTWYDFGGKLGESYDKGGRIESYVFAVLVWARNKRTNVVDRLVSIVKCVDFLQSKVSGVPPEVIDALADVAANHAPSVCELVQQIVVNEDFLSQGGATFKIPGNMTIYPEQELCMRHVLSAVEHDTALLLKYQTPPSGGKTSAAALLAACILRQQRQHDTFAIYTCYSDVVRVDVCKHLVAASVPFAVVQHGMAQLSASCYHQGRPKDASFSSEVTKDRMKYAMKTIRSADRRPCMLVCDVSSTEALLKHRQELRQDDVLLFDEPTANVKPSIREAMKSVLLCLPRRTVFMSATMNDGNAWGEALEAMTNRHGSLHVCEVCPSLEHSTHLMSVTAFDLHNQICCPHHYGHGPDAIENDFHLYRFYSPRVLNEFLQSDVRNAEIIGTQSILTYEGIRKACLKILRSGSVPKAPVWTWPDLEQELCTSKAHRLTGTTLVLASSADHFYTTSVRPLLADVMGLESAALIEASDLRRLLRSAWPQDAVVNSLEHTERYGVKLDQRHIRAAPPLPHEVVDRSATNLAASALCGVLLFGARTQDNYFALTAQHLAEENMAAFVCAGHDMIYGVNLPINRVVVNLDITSYAEMKQLCGRAGRTGRASRAEIVFCKPELMALAMNCPHVGPSYLTNQTSPQHMAAGAVQTNEAAQKHEACHQLPTSISGTHVEPGISQEPPSGVPKSASQYFLGAADIHEKYYPAVSSERLEDGIKALVQCEPDLQSCNGVANVNASGNCSNQHDTCQQSGRPGRQSPASKSFRNLTKAAAKWQQDKVNGKISEDDLTTRILASRVAQQLRDRLGVNFCDADFLDSVLRRC